MLDPFADDESLIAAGDGATGASRLPRNWSRDAISWAAGAADPRHQAPGPITFERRKNCSRALAASRAEPFPCGPGQIGKPCSDRVRRRADVERAAVLDDGATVERVGAEDRAHDLGPAGTN